MLQAIILGLVQGLTEFLPISSSGHLVLLQTILDVEYGASFDVILHTGTLLATILFFWNRIIKIKSEYIKYLIVASIPTGIAGLFLQDHIDTLFSNIHLVSIGFLITTYLLFRTRNKPIHSNGLNTKTSLLIGIAQALAIFPGISRSGSTISMGLGRGIKQDQAFTFSFLLSIPAILAATLLNLKDIALLQLDTSLILSGFISAFISGLIALSLLKRIMQKANLHLFGYYTAFLALITGLLALSS